jgi:hypothetical protein
VSHAPAIEETGVADYRLRPWDERLPPDEELIFARLQAEGLRPQRIAAVAGMYVQTVQPRHRVVVQVLAGSLIVLFPRTRERLTLRPGDRLDVPALVDRTFTSGPDGTIVAVALVGS